MSDDSEYAWVDDLDPNVTLVFEPSRSVPMVCIEEAEYDRLKAKIAELEAQLTRAGWEWAAAVDALERIRKKLRDMPQTFDDLGRWLYGDK